MPSIVEDAYAILGELIRMHTLNQELLETLQVTALWIRDYAEKRNIPLPNSSTFYSLINKAETLIEEITSDNPMKHLKMLADEKKHLNGTDEDETESIAPLYKL